MERAFTATLVAFLDQTLDAVLAADDARRFVYANRAAEQLFGENAGRILGRTVDEVVVPPPGEDLDAMWDGFIREGHFRGRVGIHRPDGQRREVEVTATAHWRQGLHVGFLRDVTERALAERRLAMQYEVAQALTEAQSIPDAAPRLLGALGFTLDAGAGALWIVDRREDVLRCAGVWTSCDAGGFGEGTDATIARGVGIPGRVWSEGRMEWVGDVRQGEAASPLVAAAAACGLATACAFPIRGSFGVIGVAEFFGAAIARPDPEHVDVMSAACEQLSQFVERRRTESQFLATGRLGWHMPLGVVVWRLDDPFDPRSLRLVATNPAFHRITRTPPWIAGSLMCELVPAAFENGMAERIALVARTGAPADDPEVPSTVVAGGLLSMRAMPLPDRCVGVIVEDVTERRRLERELLEYTGNLETEVNARIGRIRELEGERARAEKLASAGRLAARVAHEIINPLAGIKNAFALVKEGVRPDFEHAHYVPRIEREIDRIARIVAQMRELYRPVSEPVAGCDAVLLAQDVIALLEPEAAAAGVRCRLRADERPLAARLQCDGVRQILLNLLRNALDVSPRGGGIDVVVSGDHRDLAFLVADEGPGVPADIAEHMFEPFFTTKGDGGGLSGLGLGLSIAQGLASAMRGQLSLVSGRPVGAAFRLTIPRDATPPQA